MPVAGQNHGPSRRSHPRIDDHHVYRAGRKVRISLRNGQCAVEDVEGLHRVADVNDLRLGGDFQDDPLDGADEMIVKSEIGGKRDDRGVCQSVTSMNLKRVTRKLSGTPRSIGRRRMARQGSIQHQRLAHSQSPVRTRALTEN